MDFLKVREGLFEERENRNRETGIATPFRGRMGQEFLNQKKLIDREKINGEHNF